MKNSKRTYTIQVSWGAGSIETFDTNIQVIAEHDSAELFFALQDRLDDVLDLRSGESMYFQPNRDNKGSKAIITRIK